MSKPSQQTVIIADADADYLDWASRHLDAPTIEIITTTRSDEALKLFTAKHADLLIVDLDLLPFDGLELLKRIRQNFPNAVVLLTGNLTSTNSVIEATRMGAYDVLRKEAISFDLRPTVEHALQAAEQMRLAADEQLEAIPQPVSSDLIIGNSPAIQDVVKLIGRVTHSDAPVLITGESGTGKEVVASAIHQFSRRAGHEYIAINCAAIPANLLESELFGHEKGAYTGAVSQRIGRFEQCNDGTLFLDEIGDLPSEVQSKLLRVLQSGEFSRIGSNETITSNVRILAATNKNLEKEVEEDRFREDLFYRLNVVRIHIPPLRQRLEDVSLLAEHFLNRIAKHNMGRRLQLSPEALVHLQNYDWPGNVRELENTLQSACVLSTGNVLMPKDIPLGAVPRRLPQSVEAPDFELTLSQAATTILNTAKKENISPITIAERELILQALEQENHDLAKTAKALKITPPALRKKITSHDLTLPSASD
ncbi:MAG: sigma-54-dependent Fis family transcriptional regulator [Verrucomicrobia bacterium]|nr:sigma-54-dependent Fis family transcriptional regulator [Verrucomicrobiota bacterium]